jgi:hypothetical protein
MIGQCYIWTAEANSPLERVISWCNVLCYRNYCDFLHWDCPNAVTRVLPPYSKLLTSWPGSQFSQNLTFWAWGQFWDGISPAPYHCVVTALTARTPRNLPAFNTAEHRMAACIPCPTQQKIKRGHKFRTRALTPQSWFQLPAELLLFLEQNAPLFNHSLVTVILS